MELIFVGVLIIIVAFICFSPSGAVGSGSKHMDDSWRWGLKDDRDDFEESSNKKTE